MSLHFGRYKDGTTLNLSQFPNTLLGLPILKENLLNYIDRQKTLDLYCISQSLISEPKDWESHHKITGFLSIPIENREAHFLDETSVELEKWLAQGETPIYIGFGSNGVGNSEKFISIIDTILQKTNERILFCTGWSLFSNLPNHKNLFTVKYVNHEAIFPNCKAGIFHGGAGTLATMLRNNLPVIIISFYTDQPAWGKIIEKMELGVHIPVKKLTTNKLLSAIKKVEKHGIKRNVMLIGQKIREEKGLENSIYALENYFNEN